MPYDDINCDSLTNLAILDPPRWGWSAAGGIVDLCPPQERARRKVSARVFLNKQARDRKKAAKEKAQADAKEVTGDGTASFGGQSQSRYLKPDASSIGVGVPGGVAIAAKNITAGDTTSTTTNSVDPIHAKAITTSSGKVEATTNAVKFGAAKPAEAISSLAAKAPLKIEDGTNNSIETKGASSASVSQSQSVAVSTAKTIPSANDSSSGMAGTSIKNVNENAPLADPKNTKQPTVATEQASSSATIKTQQQPPSSSTSLSTEQPTPKSKPQPLSNNTKPDPQKIILQKYGLSENYNVIIKPKGRSKRDRFDLEVKSIRPDGTIHPDAYHRGVVGTEARFKGLGKLLCDLKPTDTNHGWDEPNLKLQVKIEFPLCEPDWSDDEEDGGDEGGQHYNSTSLRRNARRGEGKVFVSETERRMKREAKLAALPHFREVVQWDLSYPKTPTPMVYAADVAAEFGLSLNRTLDLARSIQNQIDDFVRENVNYHVPISSEDHLLAPRGKNSLQPPKYSNPKLLSGGHCASNVSSTLKPFEVREKKEPDPKNVNTDASLVKVITVPYEVVRRDKVPKHDFSELGLDPIYGKYFLRRARRTNRATIKKLADGNIGEIKILENHNCHFCHIRRPKVIQYPCGNDAHCYCDLHTARRFGYKISQAKAAGVDYCPICSLECTCYRCTGRVATLVPQFAKECKEQGVGPEEVNFNFVYNCSRNLAKVAKRSGEKRSNTSTSTRRKSQVTSQPAKSAGKPHVVLKVPKEDFPAELSGGINKDPSRRDDYNTIFTPEGAKLCKETLKKAREEEAKHKPVVVLDGNVDYCDICRNSGNLVCCDKCPRSFHGYCLTDENQILSGRWECPRCIDDSTEVAMKGEFNLEKLLDIFKQFKESPNFKSKIDVLSKIFDMIKYLIEYDYGDTFSEPVDVRLVRDYKAYVKRPMDLGTISKRLLKGDYCNIPKQRKDMIGVEKATEMDIVTFIVLKDIEQIWHNCFLYNREGSSFHRMGQVLREKSSVIQRVSFENELDLFVRQNFDAFVKECKLRREELSHSLKPWIQASKYQINVPCRGAVSNKRHICIYDNDTNMIIKQYTGFSATYSVAEFLTKLGYKSEIISINKQKVKDHITAMQEKPELLFFGYRWLYIDNVRSGNFKMHKGNAVVKKFCRISKCVLDEFDTVNEAYKAWLDSVSKSVGPAQTLDSGTDRTLEIFERNYLDGEGTVDDQEWERVTHQNVVGSNNSTAKPDAIEMSKVESSASTKVNTNVAPSVEKSSNVPVTKTSSKDVDQTEVNSTVIHEPAVNNASLPNQDSIGATSGTAMEVDSVSKPTPAPLPPDTAGSSDSGAPKKSTLTSSTPNMAMANAKTDSSAPTNPSNATGSEMASPSGVTGSSIRILAANTGLSSQASNSIHSGTDREVKSTSEPTSSQTLAGTNDSSALQTSGLKSVTPKMEFASTKTDSSAPGAKPSNATESKISPQTGSADPSIIKTETSNNTSLPNQLLTSIIKTETSNFLPNQLLNSPALSETGSSILWCSESTPIQYSYSAGNYGTNLNENPQPPGLASGGSKSGMDFPNTSKPRVIEIKSASAPSKSSNTQSNATAIGLNPGEKTQTQITPGRSAIEVEMAASLLLFARTPVATPDSGNFLPVKKRSIGDIGGGQNTAPDSKRPHGFS